MSSAIHLSLQWWNTWQTRSVNRRVLAAIITVGGLTILVKAVAAGKELIVARQFGTQDALDAFLIAVLLPQFVIELIGGAMNAALIPTYVRVREQEGQAAAQRLFSSVLMSSLILIGAASILMAIMAGPISSILGSGFSPEKQALTERLYFILLPMLLFYGLGITWSAVLNANERFALGAIVPMVTPLLTVVLLVGLKNSDIYVLAVAAMIGPAIEAMILGPALWRQGMSLRPRWHGAEPAVREVFRQYVPAVAASFLMGSTFLIAHSMATTLGPGSVSALAYGSKASTLLLGIGSLAVSTAVLPHFSQMVAVNNAAGVRHTLKTYSALILVAVIPVTAILIYFSEPIVRLLFQRGAFTETDTTLVSQVQAIYLIQVPLYILGILFVRLISSLKANVMLLWGTLINLVLSVVFSYVFMQWYQVVGIALSISLMYLISTSFLICVGLRILQTRRDRIDLQR